MEWYGDIIKSPLTPLCKRGEYSSPFGKGGLRGIFILRCERQFMNVSSRYSFILYFFIFSYSVE